VSWWLWMLAGAGAGQVASFGAAYALRGRLQARFASKLEQQMQAELAKAMPGLASDPAAMLGALLTQAQMRQHSHAYDHLRPFDQDA